MTTPSLASEPTAQAPRWVQRLLATLDVSRLPVTFALYDVDGTRWLFGDDDPVLHVHVKDQAGWQALTQLTPLAIAEAYMDGHLDLEGDLIQAMRIQEVLDDSSPWFRFWSNVVQPLLKRSDASRPQWVAQHYDMGNVHVHFTDDDYNLYTPGIYLDESDSLEVAAERKLAYAFEHLQLKEGDHLLEIGSGWGPFIKYAGRRGVRITSITLSQHQKQHVDQIIAAEGLDAEVLYQNIFTYQPATQFDAISMMGVMEEIAEYPRVMGFVSRWVKPGGRVYLDFATGTVDEKKVLRKAFIIKHVWPGKFNLVYLPSFLTAVLDNGLEIVRIDDDRRNYHLSTKLMYERLHERKATIVDQYGERTWRLLRLLMAGIASAMHNVDYVMSAKRLVLQRHSGIIT